MSKKLIMIIAVALIVLGGGGFAAWKLLKPKPAPVEPGKEKPKEGEATEKTEGHETAAKAGEGEDEEEDEAAGGGGHGAGPASLPILVLKPIVNLQGRKNAYLKCELHIIFRDQDLGKLAAGDKPTLENSMVRSMVLGMLGEKTLEEASDLETREALRREIKEKLNDKFAPKPPKPGEKEDPKHKKPKKPIKDVLVVDWAISQ